MKYLIITLLLCSFSFLTYSRTVIEGIVDSCESQYDVFQYKYGVYRANVELTNVSREQIDFNLELSFLLCQKTSEGIFERVLVDPMMDVYYDLPVSANQVNHVVAKPQSMSLKFMKHDIFKLIKTVDLQDRLSNQIISTSLKLEDILSKQEVIELERNKVVKTHFSFFLVKNMIWSSDMYDDMREDLAYSAYRKILEIRLDDGLITAKILN